ncbi:MAG: isoprenylcysteine carboxylmethyltransferase family protein, partial [Planctomycetaceae bacterium]
QLPIRLSGRAAAVLFVPASVLGVCSAWVMSFSGRGTPFPTDTARRLVVVGPYRFVRNPMAIAGLSQALVVAARLGSWGVLAYVLVGGVVWNVWVRPPEEEDLAQRFGDAYVRYQHRVRCWIPTLEPYRGQAES